MKTLKVLSIIGLVVAGLGIIAFYSLDFENNLDDALATGGWLIIVTLWLIAQSVTTLVQTKEKK
jgi:hypothetical protein